MRGQIPGTKYTDTARWRNRGNEKYLKLTINDVFWKRARGQKVLFTGPAKQLMLGPTLIKPKRRNKQRKNHEKPRIGNEKWHELTRLDKEWQKKYEGNNRNSVL